VLLEETPYYHCISRSIRLAFLYDEETHTNKSYEYQRQWIADRIIQLTDILAIGSCAYSVLSNHYYVILHVDTERAAGWSGQEVIERWELIFSLPVMSIAIWSKRPSLRPNAIRFKNKSLSCHLL
jgi:hypothetical protein